MATAPKMIGFSVACGLGRRLLVQMESGNVKVWMATGILTRVLLYSGEYAGFERLALELSKAAERLKEDVPAQSAETKGKA